jgi:phosphatidylserine decarboxylase
MSIDRAGLPLIAAALGLTAVAALIGWPYAAGTALLVAVALALFFRDPERRSPDRAGLVLSPADGRVMVAGPASTAAGFDGDWLQVSVFLSLLDVHVNRVPVSGQVTRVDYRPGRYHAAYKAEAAFENERSEIWIEDAARAVVCRQITGVLARRVVCRLRPGDRVRAGDRLGVMKFGSRMDLFLPSGTRLMTQVGDRVRAGETVLAELPGAAAEDGRAGDR